MQLLLALACSRGSISDPWGQSPVETAFTLQLQGDQRDEAWLLVSNGWVEDPCALGAELDAEQSQQVASALFREGSRLVLAHLYRFRRDSWVGVYPLSEEPANAVLDDRTPFAAEAGFLAVLEASSEQEGLAQDWDELDLDMLVSSDIAEGHFEIRAERDDDELVGSFSLETVDVGGRFRAERCYLDYESSILSRLKALIDLGAVPDLEGSDTGD